MKVELDGASYKPKNADVVDWALMHTRLIDKDIHAVVEYTLTIMKIRREVTEIQLPTDRTVEKTEKSGAEEKKDEFEFKASGRTTTKNSEVNQKVATYQIGLCLISLFGP